MAIRVQKIAKTHRNTSSKPRAVKRVATRRNTNGASKRLATRI